MPRPPSRGGHQPARSRHRLHVATRPPGRSSRNRLRDRVIGAHGDPGQSAALSPDEPRGTGALAFLPPAPTDVALLRALHEKVMRAHQQSKVALLEDQAPDTVFVGRGDVTRPTLEERRATWACTSTGCSRSTATSSSPWSRCRKTGPGWVIVQVRANGIQTAEGGAKEPIQFVSAWVELYQKRGGRWYRVGNVSNFRP